MKFQELYCFEIIKQNFFEIERFYEYMLNRGPLENVLEIGVSIGGTLRLWASLVKGGGNLVGIDTFELWENTSVHPIIMEFQKSMSLNANPFIEVDIIKGNSLKDIHVWKRKKWDFVFIDGGHKYPTPIMDLRNALLNVGLHSVIGIHDICWESDVKNMWEKIPQRFKSFYMQFRYPEDGKGGPGIGAVCIDNENERKELLGVTYEMYNGT